MKQALDSGEGWKSVFPSFPVALVTCSSGGKDNIITIGLVHVFSFKPPIIGIGVAPSRHSHGMLKTSREFVINLPSAAQVKEAMACGSKSGRDTDKFAAAGLTREKAAAVSAPLVRECPVSIECRVVKEVEVGDHEWFMGEVLKTHIEEGYRREDALQYWAGTFGKMGPAVGKR